MGMIGISLCDFCGKRTECFVGKLVLQSYQKEIGSKTKYTQYSPKTGRRWFLCKRCHDKLIGLQSQGDLIREDIESKIDELKLKGRMPNLLD